jgi:sulfur-oxidizing protein SoxA
MKTSQVSAFARRPVVLVVAGCVLATGALGVSAADKKKGPAAIDTKMVVHKEPWKRYGGWPGADWSSYNTVAKLGVSPPPAKLKKLEGPINGSAEAGAKLAFDRSRGGSCLACHVMGTKGTDQPGNVGPDLSQIGSFRDDEWLFNYVYDPRVYNPMSQMPPWGTNGLYTEDEVKEMVVFLKTLKAPAVFKNRLDDPAERPVPTETRDNLDPTENPGMFSVDDGKAQFAKAGPNGKSCASCHEKPEAAFKTWATTMPKYEPRLKKILVAEEFIARHAKASTGADLLMETKPNIDLAIYLRFLANGNPVKVDTKNKEAKAAIERAKKLVTAKVGQLNFSCNDCHLTGAGKWIRGQTLAAYEGAFAHFPTFRTSRSEAWTFGRRMQWCNVAIRANEMAPGAPQYADLELYIASLNNGKVLDVPGIRH